MQNLHRVAGIPVRIASLTGPSTIDQRLPAEIKACNITEILQYCDRHHKKDHEAEEDMTHDNQSEETLVNRKIEVLVRHPSSGSAVRCFTYAVGEQALLLNGAPALAPGQDVDVVLAESTPEPLVLTCRVEATAGLHAYLRFGALSDRQKARFNELIWPVWDGTNLLDGLIIMSHRCKTHSLTDWLRLTDLLSVWHPQGHSRTRRD